MLQVDLITSRFVFVNFAPLKSVSSSVAAARLAPCGPKLIVSLSVGKWFHQFKHIEGFLLKSLLPSSWICRILILKAQHF